MENGHFRLRCQNCEYVQLPIEDTRDECRICGGTLAPRKTNASS